MSEKSHNHNQKGYNKKPWETATGGNTQTEPKKNSVPNVEVNDTSGTVKETVARMPSNINKSKNNKNSYNSNSNNKNFRNNKNNHRDNRNNQDNKNSRDSNHRKRNGVGASNTSEYNKVGGQTELHELKKYGQINKTRNNERPKDWRKNNSSQIISPTETVKMIKTPEKTETEIYKDANIKPQIQQVADIEDNSEKIEIVGIRFRPVGKIYFFAPDEMKYEVNDKVIVETARGIELGYIVIKNRYVDASKVTLPLKAIYRKATEEDITRVQKNKALAAQALIIAEEKVKEHGLKLKLIEAEYTIDNSKLLYNFTADSRIDFRDLVKDLAAIFKVRIELRQIGIRDQTKILGGLSICGRPFCCNSFLHDFEQVTIKMAKEQNISINSAKISGACGRLMCCLRYEHETYESLYKDTPKVNSIVETAEGETGIVVECNVLSGTCKVKVNNGADNLNLIKPYSKKELKVIGFVKGEQENGE